MVLTKSEAKEFAALKRTTKGTKVTIKRIGPANVIIGGVGKPVVKQLGGNIGIGAMGVAKAKIRLSKKAKKLGLDRKSVV